MADDGWTETVPKPYQMPEGYLNNLEDDHWDKLYKMWDAFFSVCDRAKGSKDQGAGGFTEDWGVDTDTSQAKGKFGAMSGASKLVNNSGIEKGDDAKAAQQARTEEANMEKLLSTYGPEALRNAFWGLCKRDHPDITMLRFLRARKVRYTSFLLAYDTYGTMMTLPVERRPHYRHDGIHSQMATGHKLGLAPRKWRPGQWQRDSKVY